MSPLPTPFNRQDVDQFRSYVWTGNASTGQTNMLISMGLWKARS